MGLPCLGLNSSSSPRAGGGTPLVPVVVSPYRRGHDSNVTDRHQGALPRTLPRGAAGTLAGRGEGTPGWGGKQGVGWAGGGRGPRTEGPGGGAHLLKGAHRLRPRRAA